jgi:tetratricopeptide (TPR) repeat protein
MTEKKQQLRVLIQQARWPEAAALCQRLCTAAPLDIEAWILKAAISSEMGDFEQAILSCREALQLRPDIARLHYNLGVALQKLSRQAEAVKSYQRAIELEPTYAPSRANLALALRAGGEVEQAIAQATEAIRLQPGLAEAHDILGLALMDLQRWNGAAEAFAQANRIAPRLAAGHAHLGICLEVQGNIAQAMASYRRAVELDPLHGEALLRVGELYSVQGEPREAVTWLRRAVAATPDDSAALVALGNALMRVGDFYRNYAEAEQCFRRAIDIKPDEAAAHLGLVTVYQNQGRYLEALDCLERVSEIEPQHTEANAVKALLLQRLGKVHLAQEIVQSMLDRGIDHVQLDLAFASMARHLNRRAEAIARLEKQVEKLDLQSELHRDIHYALGKLYDEADEYELAFEQYRVANQLNPYEYDEPHHQGIFEALANIYSAESVKLRPSAFNRSKLPVFIVGMPRSGTSLVEQILASHPHVHGGGELNYIAEIGDTIQETLGVDITYPYYADMLTRRLLDGLAQEHLNRLAKLGPKAARVTDKMPHNFRWLGLIDQLFPGAQVIHCVRDPMDNCLSIHFQKFNMHHAYSSDLAALGRYYRRYQALMEHWRKVLRIRILDLRYEDLVADQEGVTRQLIEFFGLDWDDRCLRFHESERIVTTPSYDQVRQPIYRKSIGRWKNYEKHLEPLKDALGFKDDFVRRENKTQQP